MKKQLSPVLLEKYLKGNCTPAEIAEVKEWYGSFEGDSDFVSDMSSRNARDLEDELYRRIAADIDVADKKKSLRYRVLRPVLAAAAIAAAIVLIINILPVNDGRTSADKLAATPVPSDQRVKIINNTKTIYRSLLPDNSVVWLSPGARLTYPQQFDSDFRLVTMSGECFFEVTKDAGKPFIISSSSIITKVWGTSFRVRDAAGGKSAEVSVLTGKVSVSIKKQNKKISVPLKKDEVMLYSNQKITFLPSQRSLKPQKETKKSSVKIWQRVNLSFESLSLKEVVPMLNSRYGARIRIDNDDLNDYQLTADFDGFNLPEVLDALKKSLNINYEINGEDILLKK